MEFFKNKPQVDTSSQLFGKNAVAMLARVHEDALWMLENLGVKCTNQAIVDAFSQFETAGKAIMYENRIYITGDLVKERLAKVPGIENFFVPRNSFFVGGRAAFIYDDKLGRSGIIPTSRHMEQIAQISQKNFIVAGMGPGIMMADEVEQMDIMAEHCAKPIYFSVSSDRAVQRAKELQKNRRNMMISFCLTRHPLEVNENIAGHFVNVVKAGIPVFAAALPMAGISAPYCYNGVLSTSHAEALFAICAAQLLNPGCTCVHGGLPSIADPRFNYSPNYGLVSHFVLNLLMAHLNMMLDLPTIQSAGTTNEEHVTDKALADVFISHALCKKFGFHMIRHSFGFLKGMIDFSIEKFEKAIEITKKVTAREALEINIPDYDERGMEAIQRSALGMYRDDPLTTANIGRIFVD